MSPYSLFAPGGIVDALKGVGQSMGDAFKSYGEISAQRDQAQLARERLAMQQRQQEQEAQYQNAHLAFMQQQEQARERQEAARLGVTVEELRFHKQAEQNRVDLEKQGLGLREREVTAREKANQAEATAREKQAQINAIKTQIVPLYAEQKEIHKAYNDTTAQIDSWKGQEDSPMKSAKLEGLVKYRDELMGRMQQNQSVIGPSSKRLAELGDVSFLDFALPVVKKPGLYDGEPEPQDERTPQERANAAAAFRRASAKTKKAQEAFEASQNQQQDVKTYLAPNVTTSRMGFGRGY